MTALRPAQTTHRRPGRLAATGGGGLALTLILALAGCGGGGGTESPSPESSTTSAPASSSPATSQPATESPSASASASDEGADALDLPSAELEEGPYEGEPRAMDSVYVIPCLEALAQGEPIPEVEVNSVDENGDLALWPWSQARATEATEGWLRCPTAQLGGLWIPAAFEVSTTHQGGVLEGMTITDATGRTVGGYRADVEGGAPDTAEILEVVEVTAMPDYIGAGEAETAYLRSLIVDAPSGPQLMVDLVSAAEGQDPESLEVWDLGVFDGTVRDVIYGAIPLDSADDEVTQEAIDSELHAVLRTMVGSYHPGVQ